ncbi:hypothetical protein HK405_009103 [Cladochytrium tenue]|nr:hypothetical protein HK405_009103 [Cladochytrium tenue]
MIANAPSSPPLPTPSSSTATALRAQLDAFLAACGDAAVFLASSGGAYALTDKQTAVTGLVARAVLGSDDDDGLQAACLTALKVLVREPPGCEALLQPEPIRALMELGGISDADGVKSFQKSPVPAEALKCLVNCLHQDSGARSAFVDANGPVKLIRTLELISSTLPDIQFLLLRLLFLTTGYSPTVAASLSRDASASHALNKVLQAILASSLETGKMVLSQQQSLNASEIFKVIFNITMKRNESGTIPTSSGSGENETLTTTLQLVQPITSFVVQHTVSYGTRLAPPVSHAINCLLNFPVTDETRALWLLVEDEEIQSRAFNSLPKALCGIVSVALSEAIPFKSDVGLQDFEKDGVAPSIGTQKADEAITPVILVLCELVRSDAAARATVKGILTPPNIDRSARIDNNDTVTSRLIRLMTSVSMESLKSSCSDLLFEIFDKNEYRFQIVSEFTVYVGYGNAAGYLFNRGMFGDPSARPSSTPSVGAAAVNPITGQAMRAGASQRSAEWDALSEEEKEEEARRLMEMLERLNKTGIIKAMPQTGDGDGGAHAA